MCPWHTVLVLLFEFGLLAAFAVRSFAALIFAGIFRMDISAYAMDGSIFDRLWFAVGNGTIFLHMHQWNFGGSLC